jgi:hypothetical protein
MAWTTIEILRVKVLTAVKISMFVFRTVTLCEICR